jgi:signal transduction histidine kinase
MRLCATLLCGRNERVSSSGTSPIVRLKPPSDNQTWIIGSPGIHQILFMTEAANRQKHQTAARKSGTSMKHELARLSRRYRMALRRHLKQGPGASLEPALGLGRQAAAIRLETLELARIHARALVTLKLSNQPGLLKRAEFFFARTNTAIEETHRAALQSKAQLGRLKESLSRRTQELVVADRQLQRGIVRRKVMEDNFKERGRDRDKCLAESIELQNLLRQLTHGVLVAQEDECKKISCELQDEIAQTLLGINVRLLALKQEARTNTKGLKNQIASAQRLVLKSAKSVRQFARELDSHQHALSERSIMAI